MDRRDSGRIDEGFTLVEVVVAMVLLGVVSAAAVMMSVQGAKDTVTLQQRQVAITLAGQALEQARAISPSRAATGASGLVAGRSAAAVAAQWASVSASDESLTWPASDPNAALSAPALPLTSTQTLAGRTYTVNTLIGTCYRPAAAAGVASAPCTRTTASAEPTADTSLVGLMRVIAVVTWTPPQSSGCPSGGCSYSTSEMIDPTKDLVWNPDNDLIAVDDPSPGGTLTVNAGSVTTISVLANDRGSFSSTNPVRITRAPSVGSAGVDSRGVITYTAPSAGGTTVSLQYEVVGASGSLSNAATVTIAVNP